MYVCSFCTLLLCILFTPTNLEAMESETREFVFGKQTGARDVAGLKLQMAKDFENWKLGEAKDADLSLTNENTTHEISVMELDGGNDQLEKKLPENPKDEEAEDAMQLILSRGNGMHLPYNIKFPEFVEDNDIDLDLADETSSHDEEGKISSVFDRPELFEFEGPYCPPGYVYVEDSEREEKREAEDCGEAGDIYELGCAVCGSMDHFYYFCPWLHKIPPGGKLGPHFDVVCISCGMLGRACCSEGGHAVLKRCGLCFVSGHWGDTCPSYKLKPRKGK